MRNMRYDMCHIACGAWKLPMYSATNLELQPQSHSHVERQVEAPRKTSRPDAGPEEVRVDLAGRALAEHIRQPQLLVVGHVEEVADQRQPPALGQRELVIGMQVQAREERRAAQLAAAADRNLAGG